MATMVLSVFACVVPVQSATVGTLELSSPYLYPGAVMKVTLTDADLASTATPSVTVSWTGGSAAVPLTFTGSAGVFAANITNALGFGTGTVTVSYADESPSGTISKSFVSGTYEATSSDITFDRTTSYPLNGYIQINIKDWDWNTNPYVAESVTLGVSLTPVSGGTANTTFTTFTETGPSTGIFRYTTSYWTQDVFSNYTTNLSGTTGPVKVTYLNESANPFTYITLASSAVSMDVPSTFTTSGNLAITINDPNANQKSYDAEDLSFAGTNVTVVTSDGDTETFTTQFDETSANSGQFTYAVPVVIGTPTNGTGKIEVASGDVTVTVTYYYGNTVKASATSTLDTSPAAAIATDKSMYRAGASVTMTVTAPALNDDTAIINFFQGSTTVGYINAVPFTLNSIPIGQLTVKVNGVLANASSAQTITFIETGTNTGVYTATLDLSKVTKNGTALANDDVVVISWNDTTNAATSSASFTIGVAAATFTLDRTSYPTPRDGAVTAYVTVTDSEANTNAATIQNSYAYFLVYNYSGSVIASQNVTLTETGANTGTFTGSYVIAKNTGAEYIGGWLKVLYTDPATAANISQTVYFSLTNAAISVNTSSVTPGQAFKITVTDPDMNFNSKSPQSIDVDYSYTDASGTAQTGTWALTETGADTGIFTATNSVGTSTFNMEPGSTITIRYNDTTPSFSTGTGGYGAKQSYTATVSMPSNTGTLSIDKTSYGPGATMKITVVDADLNTDINTVQTTTVTIRMSGTADEVITLTETNASSSTFTGSKTWGTAGTLIGKAFQVYYQDAADASGATAYATVTGQIVSVDGVVTFGKTAYLTSEIVTVTITDSDANSNPSAIEHVNVAITSTSDPIGQTFVATETGINTGVFTIQFQISSTLTTGKVYAKNGDTLTAKYTDAYPADYGTTGKTKDFTGTATVGVTVERPVPASDMQFLDPSTGQPVSATTGTTLMLQATLKNEDSASKSFTAIFKVIDANGVTISISWVTGTLAAGQTMSPAVSWMPTAAGAYTVEVLVIKSISEPTPYSDKVSQSLTVA